MTLRYTKVTYKYRVVGQCRMWLNFGPPQDIITPYFKFYTTGLLVLEDGYCWDGPSGPTYDTDDSLQASGAHDCGYQMCREGLLDCSIFKPLFDTAFKEICLADGMSHLRATIWYQGVHLLGEQYAERQEPIIYTVGTDVDLRGIKP